MLTRNPLVAVRYLSTLVWRKHLRDAEKKILSVNCPCTQIKKLSFSDNVPVYNEKINIESNDKSLRFSSRNLFKSNEELLENHIVKLSRDIHQKNRVYKNDIMRVLLKVKELNFSTKKQGLLLIRCCSELLPDETASSRMSIVEDVWKILQPHTKFQVDHYNELLRVYIANNRKINAKSFIEQMSPVKPNITTYELLIQALAEAGDINQTTEVIANMKAQNLPATEKLFSSLILCQGKAGLIQNIDEVLTMMKSLKLDITIQSHLAIARGLAWNKMNKQLLEELENVRRKGLQFEEYHIMEIVKTLVSVGEYSPIREVLQYLPDETLKQPRISSYMESVATLLVHQNHPLVALELYNVLPAPSFGPKDYQGLHGRTLMRECVKASIPASIIAFIAQDLMSSERNPIALHNAAEAALQKAKVPLAQDLLMRMKQMGMPIRPHYFWPILIHSSKTYGEKGVMNTLSYMVSMEVKPDYDTIYEYVLPNVSFTSPQNLMKKFQETGLTVTTVLTPMLETLLSTGQVRAASELCEIFEGKVDGEKVITRLIKGYLNNPDLKSTIYLLEDVTKKASEKNRDWVGKFLCGFLLKGRDNDISEFCEILKDLRKTSLKISNSSVDFCISRLPKLSHGKMVEIKKDLEAITDETLFDENEVYQLALPHPSRMNEESLRAHLIELEAKGMNTRGVLRRLLQQYCRDGNLAATKEILDKCFTENVFLSAGMKASVFELYVKSGEVEQAEAALEDLTKSSTNFVLDEHKIIDFAALLVSNNKFDRATKLLYEQTKKRHIIGGRSIAVNCWRLLDATAARGKPEHVTRMFESLTSLRFCEPSNVILGPLVRVYLNINQLDMAVQEFVRLANKYKKTPLKHELMCQLLYKMGDGKEDDFLVTERSNGALKKMVQSVLNMDKKVHGTNSVQLTMIAALADVGYKRTLRKLFLDPSTQVNQDALMRHCERFVSAKKVEALENLAECARGLRHLDAAEIYELVLDVFQINDDYEKAVELWHRMQNLDVSPSGTFEQKLCALLQSNNQPLPPDLSLRTDKQVKNNSVA